MTLKPLTSAMINNLQARGIRNAQVPTKAKLTYFQDKSLTLELQYQVVDSWVECFTIEADSQTPLKMPNTAYLGFSAHTGELADNFDIIAVETRNLYNPVATGKTRTNSGPAGGVGGKGRAAKKSGGWGWFFVKLLLFIFVCGAGYVGYNMYRTQKRSYSSF